MSVNEKMTAIGDAIRDKTGGTEALTLDGMAAEIPKVYEEGKKAEHNAFMDNYQISTSMNMFFAGKGWNDNTFYPSKDIKPRHAYYMFRDTGITDIWGRLEELGLTLDFSTCTNFYHTFYAYGGTWHGVVDMSSATNTTTGTFAKNTNLVEIKKLIVAEKTMFNNNFSECAALEKMEVEGTIGKNGFDVSDCEKLNKASIESIINALSAKESGLTVTFSKTAVNNAFGIDIDDESTWTFEWLELRGTKSKWTFNYV